MAINEQVTKIVDTDSTIIGASVSQRGSKGAQSVEIVDGSGNQLVDFVGSNAPATTIGTGTKTITASATQLSATSIPCKRVIVHSAGGHIVIGDANIVYDKATRRGIWLPKGNSMTFNVNNVNLLYAIAETSSKNISYYYEV